MSLSAWTRALVISATIIVVGLMLMGAIWLLSFVREILLLVLLAGLTSVVLMPFVDWLAHFRAIPRPLAVLIAYLCVLVVVGGIMFVVIPPLVDQGNQLVKALPDVFQRLTSSDSALSQTLERFGISTTAGGSLGAQVQELAKTVLANVATLVRDITTVGVGIIVVTVVSFYLLNEGHKFRASFESLVPSEHRGKFEFVAELSITTVAGYMRAQLIVAFMVGMLAGFSAGIIGIRYPLIIGALAGLFELVPFFGPTLGAVPAVLIGLFQGDWVRLALIIGAFVIIQQVESNIIGPRIMAHGVGLHPLAVILAVLIGIEVAGIWGALFAVPTAAILATVGRRLYEVNRDRPRRVAA